MATSYGFCVPIMSPWPIPRVVLPVRTPSPICSGAGCPPPRGPAGVAWTMVSDSRSWNSARVFLKPVVFALARLLAMVSIFNCCASIPVAAVYSDRNIVDCSFRPVCGSADAADLDHAVVEAPVGLDGLHGGLELALGVDHLH